MAVKMLQLLLVLVAVAVTSVTGQDDRNVGLSGPEIRDLRLGQNPELLEFAAMTGERVFIVIDGPNTVAAVQEFVNANIWCLPWLLRFPGAQIRWRFLRYDSEFANLQVPDSMLSEISPPGDDRRVIGGPFNEWLNITRTVLVQGAESPDTGEYQCQACYFIGTPFEECHTANLSLQVIGGPPEINDGEPDDDPIEETDTRVVYRVGTDFCISPLYRGEVIIQCDILQGNQENRSQPFPTPDRAWFFNNDFLYRQQTDMPAPDLRENMEFFESRMTLFPDVLVPSLLTATGAGEISLNLLITNTTLMEPPLEDLRQQARREILGTWRCEANNTFGTDMAESMIRTCGAAPMLPGCPVELPVFAPPGSIVNVDCTVCIREGDVVTLDCTGASETDVTYEWLNSQNETVSTSALFTTGIPDTYTCTASNVDNPSETGVTLLAFSDAISFTGEVTERMVFEPRRDNGCSRLSDLSNTSLPGANPGLGLDDIEMLDFCAFTGEMLDLRCVTDDADMQPLEIQPPSGPAMNGSLTVSDIQVDGSGMYTCRLSTVAGPCSTVSALLSVDVFQPARIIRQVVAGCDLVAGEEQTFEAVFRNNGSMVTLCCPVEGIEDPVQAWYRIVVDETGCAQEIFEPKDEGGSENNELTVTVTEDVSYVCRARNRAGQDADIISITTEQDNFEWGVGPYSECNMPCRDGVRTRDVFCMNAVNNMVVEELRCIDAGEIEPASTESCSQIFPDVCLLDPVWISGDWTRCTRDCGGWRYRSVLCQVPMTGEIRSPGQCRLQPRPPSFDFIGCNTQCCVQDRNPNRCRALGSGYCGDEAFAKECCWTCGRKTIGIRF